MDLGKRVAHCSVLALGLLDVGWYTWFPFSVNHQPLSFIWRVGLSFITVIIIVERVLDMSIE